MQPMQHCTVSVLLVMYGLPRLLIGSIVAHELMHAYLRMRNVAGLPLQVCLSVGGGGGGPCLEVCSGWLLRTAACVGACEGLTQAGCVGILSCSRSRIGLSVHVFLIT
jgi:hypothetical protein